LSFEFYARRLAQNAVGLDRSPNSARIQVERMAKSPKRNGRNGDVVTANHEVEVRCKKPDIGFGLTV
jgi:hypothetical protein